MTRLAKNQNAANPVDLDSRHRFLYSREASLYDEHRFSFKRGRLYHALEVQTILDVLGPLNQRRVLDLATGTGRIAIELQKAGAKVVGADLTYEMMQAANRKVEGNSVTTPSWINANGRLLPFANESFDVAMSIRFLHLLPPSSWTVFLGEMHRVLRDDGLLLVELFNPLYGGLLSLVRQARSRVRRVPGEQYVWPWQIGKALVPFELQSTTPFWLPGMGILGDEKSGLFHRAGRLCATPPLKWFAGPFLVLARRGPNTNP